MKRTIEGSFAVAEATKNCEPEVVACYPITPSTHIAEELAQFYADGKLKQYIAVESEFAAISALIGASATGARTFSTTSSQGLALMNEVLFTVSGMRLPIVMAVANRALSAPLNIWNDHQDAVSERDSGWIQLYCESNQEATDTIPQAFKIAEKTLLPVMVNMDGFYLTHSVEQIDVPEKELIAKFLSKFNPEIKLDPQNPLSLGVYAFPEHYQSFREDLHQDLIASQKIITEVNAEWAKLTGRNYGNGLWEEINLHDAEYVIVAMGSVIGNVKSVINEELQKGNKKWGCLRLKSLRPFPTQIASLLSGKKSIGVFEKALSLGAPAVLYSELRSALYDCKESASQRPIVSSFVGGLGGRDITRQHIRDLFTKLEKGTGSVQQFI
ncbi:MAG: pyruvate ferredoxin oxidoreductase [Candidatus Micrarchaeota archaeon]